MQSYCLAKSQNEAFGAWKAKNNKIHGGALKQCKQCNELYICDGFVNPGEFFTVSKEY